MLESTGTIKIAYNIDPKIAKESVHAIGANILPSTLCKVKMGSIASMMIPTEKIICFCTSVAEKITI